MRVIRAIVALPLVVAVVVPAGLLALAPPVWCWTVWRVALGVVGLALLAGGLALLVATIRLFARHGGTLAPWDPPRALVTQGPYRRVRNPMILGVLALLFGEAALCASWPLLCWAAFATLANLVYMPLVEEPALARRYGQRYADYLAHVPRWWPRRAPWNGAG